MMTPSAVQASALLFTIGVTFLSVWWMIANRRKKHYDCVGKVAKLFFFPVKSLKGIEVNSVDCTERGIRVDGCDDRFYMLVTIDGFLCSQRQEPRMALLTPSISENHLLISGPEMEPLVLDLRPSVSSKDEIKYYKLHSDKAPAVDCGDEVAAWFQKFLKRSDVRLVYSAQDLEERTSVSHNAFQRKLRKENVAHLQDFAPFHLVSQESIDVLNSKIQGETFSARNFRPNILVEGCKPHDEDKWKYVKFSSGAEISHIIPCGRCILTTVNPEMGIITNKEPLVTLRKYRGPTNEAFKAAMGSSPLLGVDYGLLKKGKISVGDDVFAVVQNEPFRY